MPRTTSSATKKRQPSTKRPSAKSEAERAHYLKQLGENEARLASGLTARDEPMTPEQIETLGRVVEMQRVKLAELGG